MPSPFDAAAPMIAPTASLNVNDIVRQYVNLIKTLPKTQEDEIIHGFDLYPLIDIHDIELTFGGPINLIENEFDDHVDPTGYKIVMPALVHSDPLVYDNSNAAGIIFPTPDTAPGTANAAAAITDGASYMLIANNADLNPIDKFSFALNLYIPSSATASTIVGKSTSSGWTLQILNSTQLRMIVVNSGGIAILIIPYTAATWFNLVVSYDATFGIRAKVNNGTTLTTTSPIGNVSPSTKSLALFAIEDGSDKAFIGTAISWFVYLHGEVVANNSGAWVTDYQNGIINADPVANSNHEIITMIPFLADLDAQPPMTSGLFVSN